VQNARPQGKSNTFSSVEPFETTPASPSDYRVFVRLFAELAVPESPPSRERFERDIAPDTVVVRNRETAVGYAWARPRGDRLHVVHVVTHPQHRRRGVARALMNAVAERGRAAGFRTWMLNVKPDNVAARALYEQCGMRVALASVSMRLAWASVERLAPIAAVTTRPLAPADDGRFEAALGLSPGEISAFRALAGRILLGSESGGDPVGFAAFDAGGVGASPFRVSAPQYARALLDALRPHRLGGHDDVHVFVEGDPPLERGLSAAGAEAVMRVLRMEGEMPP
jgi:ribosomal protein S18 acetylase RimI-like enzyme